MRYLILLLFCGCTARDIPIEGRTVYRHLPPPQPNVRLENTGAVTIRSIIYRRVDSLPLLIDLPKRRKKGADVEEYIHVYDEPELVDDLKRYLTYPEILIRMKAEGTIRLTIKINRHGKMLTITGRATDNPLLVNQAIDNILHRALFKPLIIDGRPEASWCDMEIEYRILGNK